MRTLQRCTYTVHTHYGVVRCADLQLAALVRRALGGIVK